MNKIWITPFEEVEVSDTKGNWHVVKAKIDTGAYRTSIDRQLAEDWGLLEDKNILYYKKYRNSLGRNAERPVILVTLLLGGQQITAEANITDRSHMLFPILIGRRELEGYCIYYDPSKEPENYQLHNS